MTLSKLPNTSVIQRWSHVSPAIIHTPLPSSDAGASWGHSSPWRWLVYDPPSFLTTLGLRQESGTALAGPAVTQGSSEARVFQRCQVLVLKGKVRWLSYRAITSSQTLLGQLICLCLAGPDTGMQAEDTCPCPQDASPPRGRQCGDSDRPQNLKQWPVSWATFRHCPRGPGPGRWSRNASRRM